MLDCSAISLQYFLDQRGRALSKDAHGSKVLDRLAARTDHVVHFVLNAKDRNTKSTCLSVFRTLSKHQAEFTEITNTLFCCTKSVCLVNYRCFLKVSKVEIFIWRAQSTILACTVNMKEKNLRVHSPCSANWSMDPSTDWVHGLPNGPVHGLPLRTPYTDHPKTT